MKRQPGYFSLCATILLLCGACKRDYEVAVADGWVVIPGAYWTPMTNPEPFADNFSARSKRPSEAFEQVLTVFKSPIRDDQKTGLQVAGDTWVEFMIVHPEQVTAQVRMAHGDYWLLSRQTFLKRRGLNADISRYHPFPVSEFARTLYNSYIDEIDRTRSVLASLNVRR